MGDEKRKSSDSGTLYGYFRRSQGEKPKNPGNRRKKKSKVPPRADLGWASRLKALRIKHFGKRGQTALCEAAGISLTTYQGWEHGGYPDMFSDVQKIVKATDCNIVWLMYDIGEMHGEPDTGLSAQIEHHVKQQGEKVSMRAIKDDAMRIAHMKNLALQEENARLHRELTDAKVKIQDLEHKQARQK